MSLIYESNKNCRKVSYAEFYDETANNDQEYKKVFIRVYIVASNKFASGT